MNIQRIKAVLLHTWYHSIHTVETWVDLIFNPMLQLWIYVLIVFAFMPQGHTVGGAYLVFGMIFWNIVWDGQYSISIGALWEIWSQSFSNLFISSLTMNEFIVGQMISGMCKSLISFSVAAVFGYVLYHISVASLGIMVVVYYLELLLFGWAIGMVVLGLIFRFGTQIQALSWSLVFLFQVFGAVFYPASVLPPVVRWIAFGNPLTYIYEMMRTQIATGAIDMSYLAKATLFNGVYVTGGYLFLMWAYRHSKETGAFVRMEG